jgi:serine/threonine protein kinase
MRCPSRKKIEEYARGSLSQREGQELLVHADGCAACQQLLAEAAERLSPVSGARPPAGEHPLRLGSPTAARRRVQFLEADEAETLPGETPPGVARTLDRRVRASTNARTARVRRAGLLDGRYELLGLISQGGMAHVFKARHRELGRDFAVKLVLERFKDDQRMRELFFSEARHASALSHPNIAAVTDFGVDETMGFFLVMDLLEGETLRQRIRRQPPNIRVACSIIDQLVGAVRYTHQHGIIHCDLKPDNVFLTRLPTEPVTWNHVKLIDFGLSFRAGSLPDNDVGGTPPYLAPERLEGLAPTPMCDVYSLGVMLYELIARRLPFSGSTADIMAQQEKGAPPPPPSRFAAEKVEERADALVLRAMARDPAVRHPTAEAFHFELRTWMDMRGIRPTRGPAPAPPSDAATRPPLPRPSAEPSDDIDTLPPLALADELRDSPFPLAVFDRAGALRFCSDVFRARVDGGGSAARFEETQMCERDPALAELFRHAVERGEPVRRRVRAADGAPGVLILSPVRRRKKVDTVHVTWLADPPSH